MNLLISKERKVQRFDEQFKNWLYQLKAATHEWHDPLLSADIVRPCVTALSLSHKSNNKIIKKKQNKENVNDISLLKFFYVVSYLRGCVRAQLLRCFLLTYYNISWPLSALTSKIRFFHCSIHRTSAERSALVRWAWPNLRLQPNVIVWHSAHLYAAWRHHCVGSVLVPIVEYPTVRVTLSVVTAVAQHYTKTAWRAWEEWNS